MTSPRVGLFALNMDPTAGPAAAARVARLAEELGYDSLWVGEHVVLPDPRRPPSPMEPTAAILDPLISLAFLAAHTDRIRLGTGIVILPQRHPLVLAKELASLDVLSGGRLIFGLGVGYLEPELAAIGVPMASRGRRSDEYLEAMQALWTMERPAYEGRFVSFSGVDAHPRPVQRPLPVVVGGEGDAAWRRAARYGHGWYGFRLDPEQTAEAVRALAAAPRPDGLPRLEISVTPPPGPIDADLVARYAAAGVDRLILFPRARTLAELERFVRDHAPTR